MRWEGLSGLPELPASDQLVPQVDLVEQAQPAGCVAVFGYAVTPQTGTVAADCGAHTLKPALSCACARARLTGGCGAGKLTAAAQGSGSRGVRMNVNYSPALPEFNAICRHAADAARHYRKFSLKH